MSASNMKDTLGVLLAGGAGERLYPLNRDRAKPAVTFGGNYRIIDITLSNCVNSDLRRVYILTQYKALSLNRQIREGWNIVAREMGEFIEILPPMKRVSDNWYMGTADAVYQNIIPLARSSPNTSSFSPATTFTRWTTEDAAAARRMRGGHYAGDVVDTTGGLCAVRRGRGRRRQPDHGIRRKRRKKRRFARLTIRRWCQFRWVFICSIRMF